MTHIAKKLNDSYYRLLKALLTVLMGTIILPVTLQIVSRYTGIVPRYIWTEELARFCFIWIIMIGSMIAVRDGTHFDVDLRRRRGTDRQDAAQQLVIHVLMIFFALLFVRYGVEFARFGLLQTSEMSGINMASIFISFPVAGATWILFLFEHIVADLEKMRISKREPNV